MSHARRVLTHPLFWMALLYAPFVLFPVIDLTVSGWFYEPGVGWPRNDLLEFVRKELPVFMIAPAVAVAVLGLLGFIFRRRLLGISHQLAAYLALTLALGPGLLVNVLLKDNWGRARPNQIVEFGGQATFTPPLMLSDQCVSNCSFSSGHGALGFWAVAVALAAPTRWRPAAVAVAFLFGIGVGFVRIAQGGHFLSDVVFSAYLTIGVALLLRRWLLPQD